MQLPGATDELGPPERRAGIEKRTDRQGKHEAKTKFSDQDSEFNIQLFYLKRNLH